MNVEALRDLARSHQLEAQQCQQLLDEMDVNDEHYEVHFAYWRGRRDAFETASLELTEMLDEMQD